MAQREGRIRRRDRPICTFVEGQRLSLHKSTGMAYFSAADATGVRRRFYQGRYSSGPDDRVPDPQMLARAARWIRSYRASGGPPPEEGGGGLTVAQLVERFQRHAESYYGADSGQTEHFDLVGKYLNGLYGDVAVEAFGPLALRALRDKMVESGRWCRGGVNRNVQSVRRIVKWGASRELLPVAVYQALATVEGLARGRTQAREGRRVRPVPPEHVEALLPHLSRQVGAMVQLERWTGMRPGEVVILRPCDVDRSSDVWVYRPSHHKTEHHGHDRTVYLGPKAQAALSPFLLRDAEAYCFSPAEAEEERLQARHAARVTPDGVGNTRGTNCVRKPERSPGDRYDVHAYRRCLARACKAAGVPVWSPNQLRHLRATEIRAAHGLEAAKAVLGHADLRVTQVYAERDAEAARKVAAQLG